MDKINKKKVRIRRITKKNEIDDESNEKVKISEVSDVFDAISLQSNTLLNDEKLKMLDEYDDNIRNPDKSYNDTLLNDTLINDENHNDEFQHDEEMKLALNISKQDYYDEQDIRITLDISKNDYSKEFEIALELSKKEYDNKILEDNLKKENRIKSLESLCIKIKRLCFSENEKKIKIFIEDILNKYFNLDINFIYIEDNDLYYDLYKIIDSYYLIPTQKKYSKTLISKEEDLIFRDIFRKT